MTQKKSMQEKNSLCEKSMQMMLNIIKFSSFSLATMSLGDKHAKNGTVDGLVPIDPFTSFSSNLSRSKRSQALLSESYVMEQGAGDDVIFGAEDDDRVVDDGSFSEYIRRFHKRNLQSEINTDGKANAYIRRFHEKNSREYTLAASTGFVPMVLPPPPNPSLNN